MNKRLESALLTMGYDQDGKECGLKLASVLAPAFRYFINYKKGDVNKN